MALHKKKKRQGENDTLQTLKKWQHFLATTSTRAESLLRSLEQAARGTCLHVNADKMEYMYFNQGGIL